VVHGCAIAATFDFFDLVNAARVKQDPLAQGRFARVNVSRNTDVTHVLEVHLSTNYWKRSNCPIEPFARLSNCPSELAVMSITARFSARSLFKPVMPVSFCFAREFLHRHAAWFEEPRLPLRLAGTRCFIPMLPSHRRPKVSRKYLSGALGRKSSGGST
jgi:hypothetical protein